ncbi:hypothetical protein [Sphingomonas sp.]|uniref:hypothetical protein n=1 Tax=Sphingomonas sp. TaxID=28214 RepID=UPI00286BB5EE|nr:hypothetical protein [Sphingomonas sp.]
MLLITLFALASPAAATKTMALDDWEVATIVSVGSPSPTSPATYIVVQTGDLDGDGVPDDAYLKLACSDGKLTQASYQVKGPRDAASGQATGKRQHKPVTFVKEWGAATPQLSAIKPTYDVKTLKGSRAVMGEDGWRSISLANTDGLCTTAGAAAKTITKTRSNIQNN